MIMYEYNKTFIIVLFYSSMCHFTLRSSMPNSEYDLYALTTTFYLVPGHMFRCSTLRHFSTIFAVVAFTPFTFLRFPCKRTVMFFFYLSLDCNAATKNVDMKIAPLGDGVFNSTS